MLCYCIVFFYGVFRHENGSNLKNNEHQISILVLVFVEFACVNQIRGSLAIGDAAAVI